VKMAAFVKAINAKIRAHPVLNYVCSTREFLSSRQLQPFTSHLSLSGQSLRIRMAVNNTSIGTELP